MSGYHYYNNIKIYPWKESTVLLKSQMVNFLCIFIHMVVLLSKSRNIIKVTVDFMSSLVNIKDDQIKACQVLHNRVSKMELLQTETSIDWDST